MRLEPVPVPLRLRELRLEAVHPLLGAAVAVREAGPRLVQRIGQRGCLSGHRAVEEDGNHFRISITPNLESQSCPGWTAQEHD